MTFKKEITKEQLEWAKKQCIDYNDAHMSKYEIQEYDKKDYGIYAEQALNTSYSHNGAPFWFIEKCSLSDRVEAIGGSLECFDANKGIVIIIPKWSAKIWWCPGMKEASISLDWTDNGGENFIDFAKSIYLNRYLVRDITYYTQFLPDEQDKELFVKWLEDKCNGKL